jgi:DNA adenine methylase
MKQLPLPGILPQCSLKQPLVNVASVSQYSPFRYPGGKTWLVPLARTWLERQPETPATLVEPFAGGAIIGLTAAFEGLVAHVLLAELDEQVAAVWRTIIEDGKGRWLAEQIIRFELTPAHIESLLSRAVVSPEERALQTIVKNRINRGGILAKGAGKLKTGENGQGILSRWYPETLKRRILAIDAIRDRLTFVQGDGIAIMQSYSQRSDVVFFIDPPYTASAQKPGARLYNCWELDHAQLFDLMAACAGDFLMTYDNQPEIRALAAQYHFDVEPVPMKNTHHAQRLELLISRNLDWLRQ